MSPDDIFAANMWHWPDPLLKRDPMGRIIFVNAAFLQLYGGRVENWTGQVLQGWSQPNPQGMPYRFETRAGTAPNDIIYDWVEVTMADGHALAIARDITLFRKSAPTPPASQPVATPVMAQNITPQHAERTPSPVRAQTPETPQPLFQDSADAAPVMPAPAPAAPVSAPFIQPDISNPAPQVQNNTPAAPSAIQSEIAVSVDPVASQTPDPIAPATAAPQPVLNAPPIAPTPLDKPRDFERRALPIENDEAVLGSNWRDAVIAKAIGTNLSDASDGQTEEAAAAPSIAMKEPETNSSQGLRILLAEDNAINALLTRTLLEAEGCSVETVEDGALAVKAAEANSYDLVFMDMRMPNMDGLEATRKIRAMGARTEKLPIIALTANAFDDDRNACFDSGMNDFMTKPVSAEELTEMVATWTKKVKEQQDAQTA